MPRRTQEIRNEHRQRLALVERQLRWLKRLGALAVAMGAVAVLVAQGRSNPKTVEAERFIVNDTDGHVRAVLSAEAGSATLRRPLTSRLVREGPS
jgi:hypothetical protein